MLENQANLAAAQSKLSTDQTPDSLTKAQARNQNPAGRSAVGAGGS